MSAGEAIAVIRAALQKPDCPGCLLIIDNAEHLDDTVWSVLLELVKDSLNQIAPFKVLVVGNVSLLSRLDRLAPVDLPLADLQLEELDIDAQVQYIEEVLVEAGWTDEEARSAAQNGPVQSKSNFVELNDQIDQLLSEGGQEFAVIPEPEPPEMSEPLPVEPLLEQEEYQPLADEGIDADRSDAKVSGIRVVVVAVVLTLGLMAWFYWPKSTDVLDRESIPVNLDNKAQESLINPASAVEHPDTASKEAKQLIVDETPEIDSQKTQPEKPSESIEKALTEEVQQLVESDDKADDASEAGQRSEDKPEFEATVSRSEFETMSEDEREIMSYDRQRFLVQVLGVSSLPSAQKYVSRQENREHLAIYRSIRDGRPWFSVVVIQPFATTVAAREAIAKLPQEQKSAGSMACEN